MNWKRRLGMLLTLLSLFALLIPPAATCMRNAALEASALAGATAGRFGVSCCLSTRPLHPDGLIWEGAVLPAMQIVARSPAGKQGSDNPSHYPSLQKDLRYLKGLLLKIGEAPVPGNAALYREAACAYLEAACDILDAACDTILLPGDSARDDAFGSALERCQDAFGSLRLARRQFLDGTGFGDQGSCHTPNGSPSR